VKVTADAVALAVLFEAHVVPRQPIASAVAEVEAASPEPARPSTLPPASLRKTAARYGLAFVAGAGLVALIATTGRRRLSW